MEKFRYEPTREQQQQMKRLHESYQREIAPYIEMMGEIISRQMPSMIITQDLEFLHIPPEPTQQRKEIEKSIEEIGFLYMQKCEHLRSQFPKIPLTEMEMIEWTDKMNYIKNLTQCPSSQETNPPQ